MLSPFLPSSSCSNMFLRSSSLVLLRRTPRHSRTMMRIFSSSTTASINITEDQEEDSSSSLLLPTRHSRHLPPPTCLDATQLSEMTQQVLTSPPGSLFSFVETQKEDPWETADEAVQKVEFLVRGHAARIPETMWNRWNRNVDVHHGDDDATIKKHLQDMEQLLHRMEEEGELYRKLQIEQQGTSSLSATTTTVTDLEDEDDKDDFEDAFVKLQEQEEEGTDYTTTTTPLDDDGDTTFSNSSTSTSSEAATPGLTVAMVDSLLDAMAVSNKMIIHHHYHHSPTQLHGWLYKTVQRHFQDGGATNNINPHTVPTSVTMNAVLRGLALHPEITFDTNLPQLRDEALTLGMGVYADMDTDEVGVRRNSATYVYVMQILDKCLPPNTLSRGNILHGMWCRAVEEGVVDEHVLRTHREVQRRSGEKFAEWVQQHSDQLEDYPKKCRRNAIRRRHIEKEATY